MSECPNKVKHDREPKGYLAWTIYADMLLQLGFIQKPCPHCHRNLWVEVKKKYKSKRYKQTLPHGHEDGVKLNPCVSRRKYTYPKHFKNC